MGTVTHVNPPDMHRNPAFSQAVAVQGPHRTIYIGGQNAVSGEGEIVGAGDLSAQAVQVAKNIETVLDASDARVEHIVKLTIHLVEGQNPIPAFQVFHDRWGPSDTPPVITLLVVQGLAHPDFLLEIDGIAVVPESGR